jgi:hypothetical protein
MTVTISSGISATTVLLLSRVSTIDQERFCLNLPCCELATDVLIQEVVNYSDPTQSVSLFCNLHKLLVTFATQEPPLVDPADLKFYTLATLKQHVKQFEGFASMQTHRLLV